MRNILALVILVILAIYGYADAHPQGPPPPPRRPARPGRPGRPGHPGRSGRPTRPLLFDGQINGGFGGAGADNCFVKGDYFGNDLTRIQGVTSPEKCQKFCQETTGCNYFTWHNAKSDFKYNCYLKTGNSGLNTGYAQLVTSGPRNCGGPDANTNGDCEDVTDVAVEQRQTVVLITGGTDRKTSEIYNPSTKESCSLPEFSEARVAHSQDGALTCGGGMKNCVRWSPASGTWNLSHKLREDRQSHVSWETASGVYLMGGNNPAIRQTSEKVNIDGSVVESFNLKYDTSELACAIPDTENGEVIITGGKGNTNLVSVYSEAGWQRDLAPLNTGRSMHACGHYVNGKKKLYVVSGGVGTTNGNPGIRISSTEIYSDNAWRLAGNLPETMWGMSAVSINNKLLLFGGSNGSDQNRIIEFNPETESWSVIGAMKEARRHNRVTIVPWADYEKWCN